MNDKYKEQDSKNEIKELEEKLWLTHNQLVEALKANLQLREENRELEKTIQARGAYLVD